MKKHVKAYMDAHGLKPGDWIPCAECGKTATQIDHIRSRGMGGSKYRDNPENLQPLCMDCHNRKHTKTIDQQPQN